MELEVWASRDGLSAHLIIPAGVQPTEAMIREVLNRNGIVFGLRVDEIARLGVAAEPGEHLIAEGLPPVEGIPGHIEQLVEVQPEHLVPKQLEDGRVDHYSLGVSPSVEAGTLIAVRHPAIPGTPGRTVQGGFLVVPPVGEVELGAGKGCELSADGLQLRSTAQGLVKESSGSFVVEPIFRVAGDVDFHTGHIDFEGDVIIDGNVGHHFQVVATGDILVRGNVEGGILHAGGNIRVGGGVFQEGLLQARGDIRVGLLDHAHVTAGGGISVQEDAIFTEMMAPTSVLVQGTLVGGTCTVDGLLAVRKLGGKQGTPTVVSMSPRERWQKIRDAAVAERTRHEGNRERLIEGLQQMDALRIRYKTLHPDKEALVLKLRETLEALGPETRRLDEDIRAAEAKMDHAHDPVIKVLEVVRAGVDVLMMGRGLKIREATGPCTIRVAEGSIRIQEGNPGGQAS